MIAALSEILPMPSPIKNEVGDGAQGGALAGIALNTLNIRDNSLTFDDLVAANLAPEQTGKDVLPAKAIDPSLAPAEPVPREPFGKELPLSGSYVPSPIEPKEGSVEPRQPKILRADFAAELAPDQAVTHRDEADSSDLNIVPAITAAKPAAEQATSEDSVERTLSRVDAEPATVAEPSTKRIDYGQPDLGAPDHTTGKGEVPTEPAPSAPPELAEPEPIPMGLPVPARNQRSDQPIAAVSRPVASRDNTARVSQSLPSLDAAVEPNTGIDPKPALPEKVVESGTTASTISSTPTTTASFQIANHSSLETAQPATLQNSSPQTAPVIQPNTGQQPTVSEVRVEGRVPAQVEQAIEALGEARDAGRVARPEVLVRHSEFGLVSMRLEAASGDLRATLSSRDPGFIPAIQSALNERAVAASSEAATSHNNPRGQDQGSTGQPSSTFSGSSAGFGANYGSSPGSSQGGLQPRMAQQEDTTRGQAGEQHGNVTETSQSDGGARGLFA